MTEFQVHADDAAKSWLEKHEQAGPLVIAYEVHRCCGGGKICQVKVRPMARDDEPAAYASGVTDEGGRVLIDRRAAARLPVSFGLTVRGLGRLKHLDLELGADDWGELLYT
ncbi:MAG TPA: hypothetical protein VGV88_07115 [Candidatus Dormibacteraeota bacterium]|nr:hypothetical protein [Candidatus Dormibacteraeota bacterium]